MILSYSIKTTAITLILQEILESRKDICKLNGDMCFRISDLFAAPGQKPLFAQMYCIDPTKAAELRLSRFAEVDLKIREGVINMIDTMIRREHPFAKAYQKAGEIYEEEKTRLEKGEILDFPRFRVFINIYQFQSLNILTYFSS
jgi:hypothetical protein